MVVTELTTVCSRCPMRAEGEPASLGWHASSVDETLIWTCPSCMAAIHQQFEQRPLNTAVAAVPTFIELNHEPLPSSPEHWRAVRLVLEKLNRLTTDAADLDQQLDLICNDLVDRQLVAVDLHEAEQPATATDAGWLLASFVTIVAARQFAALNAWVDEAWRLSRRQRDSFNIALLTWRADGVAVPYTVWTEFFALGKVVADRLITLYELAYFAAESREHAGLVCLSCYTTYPPGQVWCPACREKLLAIPQLLSDLLPVIKLSLRLVQSSFDAERQSRQ